MAKIIITNNQKLFIDNNIKKQKNVNYLVKSNLFDQNFINKHFICRICKSILDQPKQCQECEENFCEKCYIEFTSKNKFCINSCSCSCASYPSASDTSASDPSASSDLIKTHPSVTNLLERLQFHCIFNQDEIINYSAVERHISSECRFRTQICENSGCDYVSKNPITSALDLEKHSELCEFQKVACPICKNVYCKKDRHDCAQFFLQKLNNSREKFRNLVEDYGGRLKELEEMSEYVKTQIRNKQIYNFDNIYNK